MGGGKGEKGLREYYCTSMFEAEVMERLRGQTARHDIYPATWKLELLLIAEHVRRQEGDAEAAFAEMVEWREGRGLEALRPFVPCGHL